MIPLSTVHSCGSSVLIGCKIEKAIQQIENTPPPRRDRSRLTHVVKMPAKPLQMAPINAERLLGHVVPHLTASALSSIDRHLRGLIARAIAPLVLERPAVLDTALQTRLGEMASRLWTDCYDLLEQGEAVDEKTEGMVLEMLRWVDGWRVDAWYCF